MSSEDGRTIKDDFLQDVRNVYRDLCCCCIKENIFLNCLPILVTITQIVVIVMQAVGAFYNEWIITDNNAGGVNGTSQNISEVGFNQTVVEDLQVTVFAILVLMLGFVVATLIRLHIGETVKREAMKRFCFIQFVPVTNFLLGVVGFGGCMAVASSEYENGASFYICLTASLIQMVFLPVLIVLYLNLRNDYLGVRTVDDMDQQTTPTPVGSEECG